MTCPNCNNNLPDGLAICFKCGKPLKKPVRIPAAASARDGTADNKNNSKNKIYTGIVIAILSVILLGSIAGGHFIGLYTLPLLPDANEADDDLPALSTSPTQDPVTDIDPPANQDASANQDQSANQDPPPDQVSTQDPAPSPDTPPSQNLQPLINKSISDVITLLRSYSVEFPDSEFMTYSLIYRNSSEDVLIRLSNDLLFDDGTVNINSDALQFLDMLIQMIYISDARYEISGHTDDVPISTREFPNNRQYSSEMAMVVSDRFIEHGYNPENISIHAAADESPLVIGRTAENRRTNRRVEILITSQTNSSQTSQQQTYDSVQIGLYINDKMDETGHRDYFPSIEIMDNYGYRFIENFYEGMGEAEGRYTAEQGNIIVCMIPINMVRLFGTSAVRFHFDGRNLVFQSHGVSMTQQGDIFVREE